MNSAIEIHDSYLTSISKQGDEVRLHLSAYIHKSDGTPGTDAGTGWIQDATILFGSGTVEGSIAEWPAWLWDGALDINGNASDNVIPVPLDRDGTVQLTLESKGGERIVVRGNHVRLELEGVPQYVEGFPGGTTV